LLRPQFLPSRPAEELHFLDARHVCDTIEGAGAHSLVIRFHLNPGSPCIDTGIGPGIGIPCRDYDGDLRPMGLALDIGFDEVRFRIYLPSVIAE